MESTEPTKVLRRRRRAHTRLVGRGPYGKPHSVPLSELADDEDELDYSKFLVDQFWQPVVKAKRKIKALRKQLRVQERVLADHLKIIDAFFETALSDEEEE